MFSSDVIMFQNRLTLWIKFENKQFDVVPTNYSYYPMSVSYEGIELLEWKRFYKWYKWSINTMIGMACHWQLIQTEEYTLVNRLTR